MEFLEQMNFEHMNARERRAARKKRRQARRDARMYA